MAASIPAGVLMLCCSTVHLIDTSVQHQVQSRHGPLFRLEYGGTASTATKPRKTRRAKRQPSPDCDAFSSPSCRLYDWTSDISRNPAALTPSLGQHCASWLGHNSGPNSPLRARRRGAIDERRRDVLEPSRAQRKLRT
jgi:hypothetical protein